MRYFSSIAATFAIPVLISAAPSFRRAGTVDPTDILVFKFANVLEQFEGHFYKQALSKFKDADFTAAGFTSVQVSLEQLTTIQDDENTHAKILEDQLTASNEKPITNCKFNVDAALKDVTTMLATARVVEMVGVSAYLGALNLMKDPRLLTAGGLIGAVEARHQTMLNLFSATGTAIPNAFEFALTPSEILALVSTFITDCDLGVPANTPLSITNTGTPAPGTLLTFDAKTINGTIAQDKLFCQMLVGGQPFTIPLPLSQCVVPNNINGPVAIWVTSDGQPLINNPVDRPFANSVVAGPAMAYIDTKPQSINQLIIGGKVSGNGGDGQQTTATLTVPPGATNTNSLPSATGQSGNILTANPPNTSSPATSPSVSPLSVGGPNMSTGPSPDGNMIVHGWS